MCCLFGFIDYNHNLSGKQKNRLLRSLPLPQKNAARMLRESPTMQAASSTL